MAVIKKITRRRDPSKDFVNNASLMEEVIKSKARLADDPELKAQAMTPKLAKMLILMVERYSSKPSFVGYTWKEEFKGDAMVNLCNKWQKFDENKSTNAFAYYTQIIHNCFLWTIGKEKKQSTVRDNILESKGMSPSYSRQLDNEESYKRSRDEN